MSDTERKKIAEVLREESFEAGARIIKEGDEGDLFYILSEGEAHATKLSSKGEVVVKKYAKGDYFGELALMNNRCRAASVYASIPCKVATLDSASFKRLLGPVEEIFLRNKELYKTLI